MLQTINFRLRKGITLINSLTSKKFHALLEHILTSDKEETFSPEELKKLADSLKIGPANIQLLIQSITYIFKQASKVILKPTDLQKQLLESLELEEKIADEFVKVWSAETKKDLGDYEKRLKLENIFWEQNLEIADQICNKYSKPTTRIQFKMSEANNRSKKHDVTIELDKDELFELYNKLEVIQMKLDSFQNIKIK